MFLLYLKIFLNIGQIHNFMIKTILCDLGSVIVFVDEDKLIKTLAKFSNKDKKYVRSFFVNFVAKSGFDKGKITAKQFFLKFKNNLNLKLNFSQFKKIWSSHFSSNKDMETLLKKLKKNYKLILLSNTDEIHFNYIRNKYKILDVLDDFVLSYKVGYKKPHPLIYLHALKKAKITPNKILYIDDNPQFVMIAKFFGIKSIQYKNIRKLKSNLKQLNIKI